MGLHLRHVSLTRPSFFEFMSVHLPPDIIAMVCDLIPIDDLPRVMLVDRVCYHYAERRFYSSVYLDFFDYGKRPRSIKCLQTLAAYSSAATSVRHLTARGLGLVDTSIHANFIAAITLARNITTLDIMLSVIPDSPFFPGLLTRSTAFLPMLSALNVDDSKIALQLVPTRPLHTVRIQETIHEGAYGDMIDALAHSSVSIKNLQLKISIPGEQDILPSFLPIAACFHSLVCLGIQFVLPSPSLVWDSLLDLLRKMASSLSSIHSLRIVSLVTLPDPSLPLNGIDALTRRAAEMITRDHLPQLDRIEIRWHGWLTHRLTTGDWAPIPQEILLRRSWHFTESPSVKALAHPPSFITGLQQKRVRSLHPHSFLTD